MILSKRAAAAVACLFSAAIVLMSLASPALAQQRVYRVGLTYPFPPWGVGPLEGVDYDLLTTICAANKSMKCMLEPRVSSDCVDTDQSGNMIVGAAMASGSIDGCVAWYATEERKELGAEFSDGYSHGPLPHLIATIGDMRFDALDQAGTLDGAKVGFIAGFFNDDNCLGVHYSDFSATFYSSEQSGRNDMLADLSSGVLDIVFWDSVATLPAGTKLVGVPVTDCGPLLTLMTYPPSMSRPHQADALRRDFNCGLALIRRSGEMKRICASSQHPGGDPNCVLEGPAPTLQCRTENGLETPMSGRRH